MQAFRVRLRSHGVHVDSVALVLLLLASSLLPGLTFESQAQGGLGPGNPGSGYSTGYTQNDDFCTDYGQGGTLCNPTAPVGGLEVDQGSADVVDLTGATSVSPQIIGFGDMLSTGPGGVATVGCSPGASYNCILPLMSAGPNSVASILALPTWVSGATGSPSSGQTEMIPASQLTLKELGEFTFSTAHAYEASEFISGVAARAMVNPEDISSFVLSEAALMARVSVFGYVYVQVVNGAWHKFTSELTAFNQQQGLSQNTAILGSVNAAVLDPGAEFTFAVNSTGTLVQVYSGSVWVTKYNDTYLYPIGVAPDGETQYQTYDGNVLLNGGQQIYMAGSPAVDLQENLTLMVKPFNNSTKSGWWPANPSVGGTQTTTGSPTGGTAAISSSTTSASTVTSSSTGQSPQSPGLVVTVEGVLALGVVAILVSVLFVLRKREGGQTSAAGMPARISGPTQKRANFCRNCGHPLSPTARFCNQCGREV